MLKLTDPTLKREEILRILDFDEALQTFFKVRGLPENVQEAFKVIVNQWAYDKFSCTVVALRLLDEENLEGELPQYLEEKPLHIQARVILLNYPTKRHLGKLRRAGSGRDAGSQHQSRNLPGGEDRRRYRCGLYVPRYRVHRNRRRRP